MSHFRLEAREMEKGTRTTDATVLVVDDDVSVTQTLQNWLEEAGYKCLVGTTVENAWQELQDVAKGVAVVVTDAGMHRKWNEVGLKDHIQKKNVSVIMIGASEGVEHGSYAFIAKPLVKEILLQKVGMLIQHRHTEVRDRKENAAMRKEIIELSGRSLHTPVEIVVDLIAELLAAPDLTPGLRAKVESLRNLVVQNSNLYRPTVPETSDFDPVTRSFLLSELSLFVPQSDFTQTFPCIDVDNPVMLELTQWSFDVFRHSEESLVGLVKQMFAYLDLLVHFNIRSEVLERFLATVKQMYKSNPYHNWTHAFDVTQATFCYLVHFEVQKRKLCYLDCLALLVSALCHDLGHPGVNNAHQIMTQADLAVLYNDRSVLENFHAASLFQLLREREDLNIFANLTKQQFREVRKSITDCILATDMANHYEYVTKLRVKADSSTEWDCNAADQRALLMQCIIKMADINNVARPWDVSLEWSRRVSEEFFAQGDKERAMGQDVAAFLDRNATDTVTNSINFIDFLALPFFENFGKLDAQFGRDVVSILRDNRQRWVKQVK